MKDASGIVDAVGEEFDRMTKLAVSMDLSAILHGLDAFQSTLSRMKTGNKRTELEMTFMPALLSGAGYLAGRAAAPHRSAGARRRAAPRGAARTKRRGFRSAGAAGARGKAGGSAENHAAFQRRFHRRAFQQSGAFDAWPEIIAIMKNYSHSVAAAFNGSSAYVNGEYMLIEAPQIAFDLLKRASQRDKMREAIQQVTGCRL